MAGQAVLAVLGLIADVAGIALGIVPLALQLPEAKPPQSIVRVAIGLSDSTKLGGNIPGITVWNENGDNLGHAVVSRTSAAAGTYADVPVDQKSNQQPTYLRVEGGSDSICVAYLGHSWPDGSKRGWLGDMGRLCGKQWYYSNVYINQANGTAYKPVCTWIGGNGVDENSPTQMTIHTPQFSAMGDGTNIDIPQDPQALCRNPATVWSTDPVAQSAGNKRPSPLNLFNAFAMLNFLVDVAGSMRFDSTPEKPFRRTIIASYDAQHNSTALCSDPWSRGPSFVSFYEGAYCDMKTRNVWPLCSDEYKEDCYDWDSHILFDRRVKKRTARYSEVIEWK